jgi:hypothetical protein
MKNLVLVLLLATSAVFGALYFRQGSQTAQHEARITELEKSLKEKEAALKDKEAEVAATATTVAAAKKDVEELRVRLNESALTAAQKSRQANQMSEQLAFAKAEAAKPGKKGNALSEMFSNPEMKEMMKGQQKLVLGPMVDKIFGPFFQQANMNDEQKAFMKDLLLKKLLVGAESGLDLLNGDLDPAKRQEIANKIKDDTAAYDKQVKEYLGDSVYPQFQQYEKSQGDRMQLDQFSQQIAAGGTALSPTQAQQLIEAMGQQREGFKWTTDFSDQAKMTANMSDYLTEEKLTRFADEKARYDQEMLARAQNILTPEQYTAYEKFVAAQRQMQVAGMKIAAQMFGAKGK